MLVFETERLVVKRFTQEDAHHFFLLNSNEQVMHFIRPVKNRQQSDAFLAENMAFYLDNSCLGRFAVFEKFSLDFVGTFSFLYLSGEADFHLGYALLPGAWGKGFATELVSAGIPYFFDHSGKSSIFAITHADNGPSQQVLLKCGFYRQGQILQNGEMLELFMINSETTGLKGTRHE